MISTMNERVIEFEHLINPETLLGLSYHLRQDGFTHYKCEYKCGSTCMTLGQHSLDEVMNACREASDGRSYSSSYNCNHWTENVAWLLGKYEITVHWNCSK